ncbi:MAG: 4-hydroxythreonine-4-phosphate dehydrogenase PdxA [Bacteroidia bacterium]
MADIEGQVKIGISIGDTNGIGLEVIMKTFSDTRMMQVCTPVIYGSAKTVSFHRKALNLADFNYNTIRSNNDIILRKINLINCWEEEIKNDFGIQNEIGGKYAFLSLKSAVTDLLAKKVDVLVTAPINKKNMQQDGFDFPGHTEYLAAQAKAENFNMMLVSDAMRVAFVTGHTPLKNVASQLSKEKILAKLKVMHESLKKDFGIRKPKIAVLALNPHAGDSGLIGTEENEIIAPAIKETQNLNILATGPFSADGFFGSGQYKKFDGILCMYHDQGLIPFKSISFNSGVNFTAGLPFVRTSPDHGTGYDIAGKGIASEDSFREAVYLAIDIFNKRAESEEINSNPLAFSKKSGDR